MTAQPAESLTGAQSLVRSLESVGAEVVFGIPGGAILPAYDPLFDSKTLRHILVRHEQGGGPRGRGLRAGHRQGRRLHGDQRPRARPTS
jgi:acetolactate synthase-1/2/3 large subunit